MTPLPRRGWYKSNVRQVYVGDMFPTESKDAILGAVVFMGTIELFFTLLVALACSLVLVGGGILLAATPPSKPWQIP